MSASMKQAVRGFGVVAGLFVGASVASAESSHGEGAVTQPAPPSAFSVTGRWHASLLPPEAITPPTPSTAPAPPHETPPPSTESVPTNVPVESVVAPIEPASPKPPEPTLPPPVVKGKELAFWDRFKIRGYTQFRYNRIGASNPGLVSTQGDRYVGFKKGFGIRRARLILQGEPIDRIFLYLQPDFANVVGDVYHAVVLRDWYADIALDDDKTFRFRVGQSKVPYGFENMQSSQNRIAFDRSDALNSAVKDERDLGVFFYWAPVEKRALLKRLVDDGLKGSGDYGVFALGVFNGQTANRAEANDNLHTVARVTWPFEVGSQIMEIGGGGYTGKYVIKKDEGVLGASEFRDARVHGTFVLYPQPFGIQAEYNVGVGPEYLNGEVVSRRLQGGYVLLSYRVQTEAVGTLIPYVRGVRYTGGKKFETNAPPYRVKEVEMGVEWQIWRALELTSAFALTERNAPSVPYQPESGRLFRLQLQVNY